MSYSVENLNDCTKKIVFDYQNLDLTKQIKEALKEKQKTANIKGFRPGKAPAAMVEKFYGPQIESDAINRFVQDKYVEAITEAKLKVVGYPKIEDMKYEHGKSVSFKATVEIFPEVKLKDMKGLTFTSETVSVDQKDIEDTKKNYLSSKAEMTTVENAKLKNGHHAVINFEGEKKDGSRPSEMKGSEFVLEIGSGQFIPGFEEGCIGMSVGEKRVVPVVFPENYQAQELQGEKVDFHIELLEVKEKKYPEFTDALAKDFGFDSVEDFNQKTKESIKKQKERKRDEELHQKILEKLVELNSFTVPHALIHQQEDALMEELKPNLKRQGFTDEMIQEYYHKWHDDLHAKAEFQVKSGLILNHLAKEYSIEATAADLELKIEETAKMAGMKVEDLKKYYSGEEIKKNLLYGIREEKTFAKIKEIVTVIG